MKVGGWGLEGAWKYYYIFFVPSAGKGFDRNELCNQEIGWNLPEGVISRLVGLNEPKVFSPNCTSFNNTFYKHRFERNFYRLILNWYTGLMHGNLHI